MTSKHENGAALPGHLYVVATPIGNMEDLTPRAHAILSSVELICAEDTRQSKKLFHLAGIASKPDWESLHNFNERHKLEAILERLVKDNHSVALVSDAGTPCIADPGYHLVRQAREHNIAVHPVPGVSAPTTLLSVSGLASNEFLFLGFLPKKEKALTDALERMKHYAGITLIFLESPKRVRATLDRLFARYPQARVVVGRELTKLHEETFVVTATTFQDAPIKELGEYSLAVLIPETDESPLTDSEQETLQALARGLRIQGWKPTTIAAELSKLYKQVSRKDVYNWVIQADPDA